MSATVTVTEIPRRLEPVTPDPFIAQLAPATKPAPAPRLA
jgi:hypothetical protein